MGTDSSRAIDCALDYLQKNPVSVSKLEQVVGYLRFEPLATHHFLLLHNWLNEPHVAQWWNDAQEWDYEGVEQKYSIYVQGYKIEGEQKKAIHAYIMSFMDVPVGFIQYYNAYDYTHSDNNPLDKGLLPSSLAALDVYIGDVHFIGKGLGPVLVKAFIEQVVWTQYDACFVDPDSCNQFAVIAYQKAGFVEIEGSQNDREQWMLKYKHLGDQQDQVLQSALNDRISKP